MTSLARAASGFPVFANAVAQALAVAQHGGLHDEQALQVRRWPDGTPITPTLPPQPNYVAPGQSLVRGRQGPQPYNGDPFVGETPPGDVHPRRDYAYVTRQLGGSAQPGAPSDYGMSGVGPNAQPGARPNVNALLAALFHRQPL